MEPYPKHCLICGSEIRAGIDAHVRYTHKMGYEEYCEYFRDAVGSYGVFVDESGRTVMTITRLLKPT